MKINNSSNPKRQEQIDKMRAIRQEEQERRNKRKKDALLRKELENSKRKIIVNDVWNLTDKYEFYDISVDTNKKIAILRQPLEVKYMAQFRNDCAKLGLTCEIISKSMNNIYKESEI